jgi:formylglycine-generating enzyme required for sulfatase activity
MRRCCLIFAALATFADLRAADQLDDLVFVKGGTFRNPKSSYYVSAGPSPKSRSISSVADFYIAKHEVTQKEWIEVMGSNPSRFTGDNLPVEQVSWYDCIEYCNRRSARAGLKPCYRIDRTTKDPANRNAIDELKWTVTFDPAANGYRLPTDMEWEYAATGGALSRGFTYSGSDDVEAVAWYWINSGDRKLTGLWLWPAVKNNHDASHPVGQKAPNELGLFDFSGNVREWCWDWYAEPGKPQDGCTSDTGRVWRGGGWLGVEECCECSYRGSFEASGCGADQGLRVCRSK